MKSKKSESLVPAKPVKKNAKAISKKIDYSDIPELSTEQLSSMRRVGRPLTGESPKLMIAIRLDPKLIKKLKLIASKSKKGYQTLIQEILEKFAA